MTCPLKTRPPYDCMKVRTSRDDFFEESKDAYGAEDRLAKTLPKMVEAAEKVTASQRM